MKKIDSNHLPGMGMLLCSLLLLSSRHVSMPDVLRIIIVSITLVLEFVTVYLFFRSPAMKNSRLRRWKLRLIGKNVK